MGLLPSSPGLRAPPWAQGPNRGHTTADVSGAPPHAWGDVTCCPIPVPSPGIRGWDTAHPKRPLPGHSLHPQPTHWGQAAWAGLLPPSTTPHHLLPPWGTGAAPGGPHGTKPPRARFPGDGEGDGEAGTAAAAQLLRAQVLLRSPPSTWPCQEFVPSRHGLTSPVYRSPLQTRSASGRCWPRGPALDTRAFVFASSSCPPRAPLGVPVSPARSGGDVRLLRLCAVDVPHLLMLFLDALSLLLLSIPIPSPSAEQCGPTSLETLEDKLSMTPPAPLPLTPMLCLHLCSITTRSTHPLRATTVSCSVCGAPSSARFFYFVGQGKVTALSGTGGFLPSPCQAQPRQRTEHLRAKCQLCLAWHPRQDLRLSLWKQAAQCANPLGRGARPPSG